MWRADGGSVKEMHTMTDPRKSLIALSLAVGFGTIAGLAPASAAPVSHPGLTSPDSIVVDAGYRRALKRQPFYNDYYVTDFYAAGPSYRVYRTIPGGNNEIRELQRLFPETNWPPSLRY
jgi:hypothetical protein